ncbi:MAG: endoglycoceramidase [Actinomycetia bacterium]|nr:endoglycoceramidase [Actinomycetes bacterium]
MRRALKLLAAATVAASVLTLPAGSPATAGAIQPPLGHAGRWITDAQGRHVTLHGMNMVAKVAPFIPDQLGFGDDDAAFLAAHGFNAVRLGIVVTGLEPSPGHFDEHYLASLAGTVATLARHGIRSLIWFPQELYNIQFKGNGMPNWMVRTDGIPISLLNGSMISNFLVQPALLRTVDNFWNNKPVYGKGLQDWIAQAWQHVARKFHDDPAVLGYDIWNEPWPGTAWPSCLPPAGCPAFDKGKLAPYIHKVTAAIHAVDPRHLVFYEPTLFAAFGAPYDFGKPGDSRSAISFHAYCLDPAVPAQTVPLYALCDTVQKQVVANAEAQSQRSGDAMLLSEFGATNRMDEVNKVIRLADQSNVGWLEWSYCHCKDQGAAATAVGLVYDPAKPPTGANVNMSQLNTLDEPYPQAIAGSDESYGFDPATLTFTLEYRPGGSGDTIVYTSPLHYPNGYRTVVTGASITSKPGAPLLVLHALPGSTTVTLTLTSS